MLHITLDTRRQSAAFNPTPAASSIETGEQSADDGHMSDQQSTVPDCSSNVVNIFLGHKNLCVSALIIHCSLNSGSCNMNISAIVFLFYLSERQNTGCPPIYICAY